VKPRDLDEDGDDHVHESSDDDSNSNCSSTSNSDSSVEADGAGEEGDKQRSGILLHVEQKITNFFRTKPSGEQRRPEPRQEQEQAQTEQVKDPRRCCATRMCHCFRRQPPNCTDRQGLTGNGSQD
jgi:hypothetical protein